MSRSKLEIEFKVGIFVALGVILIMMAIILLGGSKTLLDRKDTYFSHFPEVDGLIVGSKVVMGGIRVGVVDQMDLDPSTKDILITFKISKKYSPLIREDSRSDLVTQGVLGDKYVVITTGSPESPSLPSNSVIVSKKVKNLTEFLSGGEKAVQSLGKVLERLDRILTTFDENQRSQVLFEGLAHSAQNLAQITKTLNQKVSEMQVEKTFNNLNGILEKLNNGSGTAGALINDPALYDEMKALVGGANRNRVIRNLVRKTIQDSESQ